MVAQILAALRSGATTSQEIAAQLGSRRSSISVALCELADRGRVERAGAVNTQRIGRPYLRWRVRDPVRQNGKTTTRRYGDEPIQHRRGEAL